jgi:hypothetical protein
MQDNNDLQLKRKESVEESGEQFLNQFIRYSLLVHQPDELTKGHIDWSFIAITRWYSAGRIRDLLRKMYGRHQMATLTTGGCPLPILGVVLQESGTSMTHLPRSSFHLCPC